MWDVGCGMEMKKGHTKQSSQRAAERDGSGGGGGGTGLAHRPTARSVAETDPRQRQPAEVKCGARVDVLVACSLWPVGGPCLAVGQLGCASAAAPGQTAPPRTGRGMHERAGVCGLWPVGAARQPAKQRRAAGLGRIRR